MPSLKRYHTRRRQARHHHCTDGRTQPLSRHRKEQALKYTVGVGRSGQQWFGTTRIASKHLKPGWKPPVSLRGKRSPDFYIEGGSPKNPMGAAALVLVDHELAIHGTNNPGSIGGFVSAGCIRMHNKDVMDLYGRVNVGTR
jgi:lipoprotein-anchoring transpeptidase ErfK/SrfK